MLVAVTYENGQIGQHFGHTEYFKMFSIENGVIEKSGVISTMGNGHGALAGFLTGVGCDVLICGGIGPGAVEALSETGIQVYAGYMGDPDAAVNALISGELEMNSQPTCDHHHEGGHDCGSHSCGTHKCN